MSKQSIHKTPLDTAAFMRWALLAPMVLPLMLIIANVVIQFVPALSAIKGSSVYGFGGFIVMSSAIALLPYTIFLAISWNKLKRKNRIQALHFILFSPIIFFFYQIGFSVFVALVNSAASGLTAMGNALQLAAMISGFVLPVGYGYVALILVVYAIARRILIAKGGHLNNAKANNVNSQETSHDN